MKQTQKINELYAFTFKSDGSIVTPASFGEFWDNYGGNDLCGWRVPKKIYYKLHQAKSGFRHIPSALKEHIEISVFRRGEAVVDGEVLKAEQEERRIKKEKADKIKYNNYKIQRAKDDLERAQKELDKLKSLDKSH